MKFGVLFRIQIPPNGKHIGRRMREAIPAWKVAEDAGFDGVFVPERQMMDDTYLPGPFPLLGASLPRCRSGIWHRGQHFRGVVA